MTMDFTAIILAIISFLSGLGWMLDRKKHRQEIESLKADNRMKDMELGKAYVDEFRSNIARPLQEEVKDLRMEIAQLRNAIQRIRDCPHSAACPVRDSLQHEPEGDGGKQSDGGAKG